MTAKFSDEIINFINETNATQRILIKKFSSLKSTNYISNYIYYAILGLLAVSCIGLVLYASHNLRQEKEKLNFQVTALENQIKLLTTDQIQKIN